MPALSSSSLITLRFALFSMLFATVGRFTLADELTPVPEPMGALVVEQPPAPVVEQPASVAIPDLSGTWCGSWQSCSNGHKGPLRATFCKIDNCHYQVRFVGRFLKILPFNYSVVLRVTGYQNGDVQLGGSHRLGPIMGTFSFSAAANSSNFKASYSSRDDQGWFVMSKCCP